jgi:hypothetical protein
MQRLERAALVCALVNIPLATAWTLMRVDVGCVLIRFGSRHGVHESAFVAIALGGPLRTILLARLARSGADDPCKNADDCIARAQSRFPMRRVAAPMADSRPRRRGVDCVVAAS